MNTVTNPTAVAKTIVLVRVPEDGDAGVQSVFTQYEAMGLGFIAAALRRAGHIVHIIDCKADEVMKWRAWQYQAVRRIRAINPDMIGFSLISSMNYGNVTRFAATLRRLKFTAVFAAGGEQATLYAKDVLNRIPGMDACLTGEAEESILEFVANLDKRQNWWRIHGLVFRTAFGIQETPRRPLINDLDALAWPARDHLSAILAKGGETVITKSRGCWGRCTFCSIIEFHDHKLGPAWRTRSAADVVAEMKYLYETYGADRFWFVDDEFFNVGNPGRQEAEEFFRLLAAERLPVRFDIFCRAGDLAHYGPKGTFDLAVAAGLRRILCGIESGSKEALKLFNKGSNPEINMEAIREAERRGIDLLCEFILFNPWSTISQVEECLEFLQAAPRGNGEAIGKYNPINLSSSLYMHRETPLGREFIEKHAHLRDLKADTGGDDFVIPYVFEDSRVQLLHDVVVSTLQRFAPLEGVIEVLLRLTDRLWVPDWSDRPDAEEIRAIYRQRMQVRDEIEMHRNEEALSFFTEVLEFVKNYQLADGPEALHAFREQANHLAQRQAEVVDNIVTYLYTVTVDAIEEVWDLAAQYDLLGPRTEKPVCLLEERR